MFSQTPNENYWKFCHFQENPGLSKTEYFLKWSFFTLFGSFGYVLYNVIHVIFHSNKLDKEIKLKSISVEFYKESYFLTWSCYVYKYF